MNRANLLKWIIGIVIAVIAVVVVTGLMLWRFTGPVTVHVTAEVNDLPFEVETIPPVVFARPGEMVRVIYRIRNNDIAPLEALGRVEVDPANASDQIQIFITQCSGLNAFQNGYPQEYEVLFRVQPAGLTGYQQITLRHVFDRATLR